MVRNTIKYAALQQCWSVSSKRLSLVSHQGEGFHGNQPLFVKNYLWVAKGAQIIMVGLSGNPFI